MTYQPVDVVEVRAWGRTVGAVVEDPRSGFYAFEYDPAWVRDAEELSPLLMPRSEGVFVFPDLRTQTFQRLPPMLADSLPDRFGNALVDAWMVEQGIPTGNITPLDRLAYAADRGMGALEFRPPAGTPADDVSALQLADLVVAARAAIRGDLRSAPKDALRELIQVGTSAGGARAKAVVAYNPETEQIRSGQLDAPDGFEHWIVKLDGVDPDAGEDGGDPFTGRAGFGRVEYAYYLMATAAGVRMAESRLLPEGSRAHFMTRRFDRADGSARIHMQSLCGLAGLDFNLAGAHSYAQYFETIHRLGLGSDALDQAFRRMVFNVGAVNRDDHTKNLAFLLPEAGGWSLAPAFDVIYAHNPSGRWTSQHQMSVNGKRDDIEGEDLIQVGDRFGVPSLKATIGEVLEAIDRWMEFAEEVGVSTSTATRIGSDMKTARPS